MQALADLFQQTLAELTSVASGYLSNILGAGVILILGWLLAWVAGASVRAITRRALSRTRIGRWLSGATPGDAAPVAHYAGKAAFYLVMLFVLAAFFEALRIPSVSEPLSVLLGAIVGFVPQFLAAGVLVAVAVAVASALRHAVSMAARRIRIRWASGEEPSLEDGGTRALAEGSYWFVLLLFLPAVLDVLAIEGLLAPVRAFLERILAFVPNMLAAALILAAGWFAARFARRASSNLLAASGFDRVGESAGLRGWSGSSRLSELAGRVVQILVLVPAVIAALDALSMRSVTEPAVAMLGRGLAAIPSLLGAALLLAVSYLGARVVSGLLVRGLAAAGFDDLVTRLGFAAAGEGSRPPSAIVGALSVPTIVLLASIEALSLVGFASLAGLLTDFTVFAANVLVGLAILALGLYISRVVADAVASSGTAQAQLLATIARASVVVLSSAMALQQMRVGTEILVVAFAIVAGSIGVGAAIAFGIGAREIAGRWVERWETRFQDGSDKS